MRSRAAHFVPGKYVSVRHVRQVPSGIRGEILLDDASAAGDGKGAFILSRKLPELCTPPAWGTLDELMNVNTSGTIPP